MSWVEAAEPLTMHVTCDGQRHRLRWDRGCVITVDHPELEAELALVALGGEEPPCIALHRLWSDAVADGGFVAEWVDPSHLSPTWFSWLAMALERMRTEGFHEFLRHLPMARARRMGEFLLRFPVPWIDRAAAGVSRAAVEADPAGWAEHGERLRQAAANRLRRAFVDAVGGRQLAVGAAALVPLSIDVSPDPDLTPRIGGHLTGPERGVAITVGSRWLHDVWAPGLAVVDGYLILAIDRPGDTESTTPAGAAAHIVNWSDVAPQHPTMTVRALRP